MIWATLALLGVPIWLVVGALVGAMLNRHHFRAQDGVVPLLFRAAGDDTWPRRLAYGRYVHNVLIVNHGLAQIRTSVHVVEQVDRLDLGDTALKHIADPSPSPYGSTTGTSTSWRSIVRTTRCPCPLTSRFDDLRDRTTGAEIFGRKRAQPEQCLELTEGDDRRPEDVAGERRNRGSEPLTDGTPAHSAA